MTRTYLDAGVLITVVRDDPSLTPAITVLFDDPDRVFVSSVFVRLEVLPKAIFHRNPKEVMFYRRFFDEVAAWAEPLEQVVDLAEQEAARFGLNALDALHVAAAIVLDADELVTSEGPGKPIHRVTSVKVVGI